MKLQTRAEYPSRLSLFVCPSMVGVINLYVFPWVHLMDYA